MSDVVSTDLAAWQYLAAAILGYLLGSIPFGLLLTKAAGLGDIRDIGSGNIGATNVLRTGSKPLALATLLLDGGKGAVAVLIAAHFSPLLAVIAGGAALLGHLFPVWLKFKGGKGVATTLGILIALNWMVGIAACLTWLVVAFGLRISSLSALIAVALAPFYAYVLGTGPQVVFAVFAAALVWLRHHENIARLLNGTEPRIGKKKAS